jgi:hypothetical protein
MECRCGSGQYRYPLYDGHGIFLTYVCSSCEGQKLKGFRPNIAPWRSVLNQYCVPDRSK